MDDSSILDELFHQSALVTHQRKFSGKAYVHLTEPKAPDSSIKISGIPEDAVVINVDCFEAPSKLFAGKKKECKRADFAIISPSDRYILFIEMKRGDNSSKPNIAKQLAGAAAVIDYCRSIGRRFWKELTFLQGYSERFVCFTNTGLDKRKTKIENKLTTPHDTPEKFIPIRFPNHITFNQLIGKLPNTTP